MDRPRSNRSARNRPFGRGLRRACRRTVRCGLRAAITLITIVITAVPPLPMQAWAADWYWDGADTTNANNLYNGFALGGTGTWDNQNLQNWWTGSGPDTEWDNDALHTAVFWGSAGTVTLDGSLTVGGLKFNSTGYVISGSTSNILTFGNTGAAPNYVSLNNVASATIGGTVAGTGNLIFNGGIYGGYTAGTVTFNGTSAGGWSGTTTIGTGVTVALAQSNQALLNTFGITLRGGGITLINTSAAEALLNRISDDAGITSHGGTINFTNTSGTTVYSETLSIVTLSTGLLNLAATTNQAGAGSQLLTLGGLVRTGAANSSAIAFSATTTGPNTTKNMFKVTGAAETDDPLTAAREIIGPWATVGTGAAAQTDYAVFDANAFVVGANIAATTSVDWTLAASAYTLSAAAETLGGTRTIAALRNTSTTGTLTLASGANLETYGVLNGAATLFTIAPGTGGTLTTPSGGGLLFLTPGAANMTVSAPIGNNGGNVTVVKSGGNTLTLSGTNSYSGGTIINSGVISVATNANLGDVTANASVTFNGAGGLTINTTGFSTNRTLVINDHALATLAVAGLSATFNGPITGSGVLAVTITNNGAANLYDLANFTGAMRIDSLTSATSGVVSIRTISDISSTISLAPGTSGTTVLALDVGATQTLTLNSRQVVLSAVNATTTGAGALRNNATAAGVAFIVNSDLLVSGGLAGTRTLAKLQLDGTNAEANAFNGRINDGVFSNGTVLPVQVLKAGGGTWTLGGANAYTGGTSISAGTLIVTSPGNLGPGPLTMSGGTLALRNDTDGTTFGPATLTSSATFGLSVDRVSTGTGLTLKLNNVTVTAATNATLTTTHGNGYALEIGALTQSSATATTLSVANGGALTIASFTSTGTATPTLSFTGAGTATITGSITQGTGALGLTRGTVGGTLILLGTSDMTGPVTITNGTIQTAVATNAFGSTTGISIGAAGILALRGDASATFGNGTTAYPVALTASQATINVGKATNAVAPNTVLTLGTLSMPGAYNLNITGDDVGLALGAVSGSTNNSKTITNSLTGGTLTIASYQENHAAALGITFTGSGNTVVGDLSQNGTNALGLTKNGAGTLSLNGANTFTGAVTLTAGTLRLGSAENVGVYGPLGIGGTVTFGGGTLQFTATNTFDYSGRFAVTGSQPMRIDTGGQTVTFASALMAATAGTLTKLGTGTLVLTAVSSYTGGTTVDGGTLQLSGFGALPANRALTVTSGTMDFSNAAQTISTLTMGGGAVSTSSSVTMNVTGQLTLGGDVTYLATNNPLGAVISGGSVDLGATRNFIIADSTNAAVDMTITSSIFGTGVGIIKQGAGTLGLAGGNTFSGAVTVAGGTLLLDYSAVTGQKISSSLPVNFTGGTLALLGNGSGTTNVTVGGATFNAMHSGVSVTNGTDQTASLALGAITRSAGSTANFSTSSADAKITTTNPAGLLGPWATFGTTGFALVDGSGEIVAAAATVQDDVTQWMAGQFIVDQNGYVGTVARPGTSIAALSFSGPDSTVTIDSRAYLKLTERGILVSPDVGTNSVQIVGGSLRWNGELVVTQNNTAAPLTIASSLGGTQAITKSGYGTLLLSGNNTQSGQVTVVAGVLQLSGGRALGDAAGVVLANSSVTLQLLSDETIGTISGGGTSGGTIDLGGNALTLAGSASATFSGLIAGSGVLIKSGSYVQTIDTRSHTGFTGDLVVSEGSLFVSSVGNAQNLPSVGSITISGTGALNFSKASTSTANLNQIRDAAPITLSSYGNGTYFGLQGTNGQDRSGNETLGALTIVGGASAIAVNANANNNGDRMAVTLASITRGDYATLYVVGRNLGTLLPGGGVSALSQSRLIFTAAPPLVGGGAAVGGTATNVSIIRFATGQNAATIMGAAGGVTVANSRPVGFLGYSATNGVTALHLTNEYQLDAAGYDASADANDNLRFTTGATGLVTKTFNAIVFDSSAGSMTVSGVGGGANVLTVNSGAMLFTSSVLANATLLDGFDGIAAGAGAVNEYIVTVANTTAAFNSKLSTVGAALTKSGSGTLVLNVNNDYTQGTNFNQGVILVDSLARLGPSGALRFYGGTLRWATGASFDPSARAVLFGIGGGTFDTNGNDVTVAGSIGSSGVGGLTKTGTGTLLLQAANTYAGPTVITTGTLAVTQNDGLGTAAAGTTVGSGTTLDLRNVAYTSAEALTVNGGTVAASTGVSSFAGAVAIGVDGATVDVGGAALSLGGVVSGAGGITKSGTGTLVLGNDSTYSGATSVSAGKLVLDGSLSASSVTVGSVAALAGNGTAQAVTVVSGGSLSPSGGVVVGEGVGSLTIEHAPLTLAGGVKLYFEFRQADGSLPGTSWDLIELVGDLGVLDLGNATALNPIDLYLGSRRLDDAGFGGGSGDGPNANGFNPLAGYEWLFIQVDDLANLAMLSNGDSFGSRFNVIDDAPNSGVFDTAAGNPFASSGAGTFSVEWRTGSQGSGLYVQYAAVPEPGSLALVGIGAIVAAYRRRRQAANSAATVG